MTYSLATVKGVSPMPSIKQFGKFCHTKMLVMMRQNAAAQMAKMMPASYFRSSVMDFPMRNVAMRKAMLWKYRAAI